MSDKILVVTSDHELYAMIETAVGGEFGTLDLVDSANALSEIEREQIQLLIVDTRMSTGSGIGLLSRLRERNHQLPAIIITPNTGVVALTQATNSEAADLVHYPLDGPTLKEAVRRVLQNHDSAKRREELLLRLACAIPNMRKYTLKGMLGHGTMGIVFRAEHESSDGIRTVAVKILKAISSSNKANKTLRMRFENEARAVSSVKHPNIIKIIECNTERDAPANYIVMEYVDGESLEYYINHHEDLGYVRKAKIIYAVAAALSALHRLKIYHRDIKPRNIMVTNDFDIRLTDFGIVKMPNMDLTHVGELVGSPYYMAPEQFTSSKVDNRADIFSLGVMAYELFLGQHPFVASNISQVSYLIQLEKFTAPKIVNPEFPRELGMIIARMLQKNPDDRYQTAKEVCTDLGAFIFRIT